MEPQQSPDTAVPSGTVHSALFITGMVLVVVVAVVAYFYFLSSPSTVPIEEPASVPTEDTTPPDVAADISANVQNPTEDLPDTNPFEASTNPFDSYQNPFDR